MPPETLIDLTFTSLISGAVGALVWTRMNRLEAGLDEMRSLLAATREQMATRSDLDGLEKGLRAEMRALGDGLRAEMSILREEVAIMRSDLTHVALAVGANRPKPMEG